MYEQDNSVRNMALLGVLIGAFFWWLGKDAVTTNPDREPTASEVSKQTFRARENYKPTLPVIQKSEIANELPANQVIDDSVVEVKPAQEEFVSLQADLKKKLDDGLLEEVLEVAKYKLNEKVSSTNEIGFISYLQQVILNNSEDREDSMDITVAAMKSAKDPHVRRALYDQFTQLRPEQIGDFNQELSENEISVQ